MSVEGQDPAHRKLSESWLGEEEAKRVLLFCEVIGDRLGLPSFRYVIGSEPTEEDNHASVTISSQRYVAVISVHKDWKEYSPLVKSETLLHEVLHCVLASLDEIWNQACFNGYTPQAVAEQLHRTWVREAELAVDLLTMFVSREIDLAEMWEGLQPKDKEIRPPGPS